MSQVDSSSNSVALEKISQSKSQFKFHGNGSEFFGIWIVNILLSIVTLGIYSAWAKVRTNNYFYGNTEFDGDRFEYLAKPMQILIGRIIAIFALIAWSVLNSIHPIVAIVSAILLMIAVPFLAVRNTRFDARVTRFRNVRFDFQGDYAGAYISLLLKPLIAYAVVIGGTAAIVVGVKAISDSMMSVGIGLAVLFFVAAGVLMYAWVTVGFSQYIVNGYRYGGKAFSAKLAVREYIKIALTAAVIFAVIMVGLAAVAYASGIASTLMAAFGGASGEELQNNPSMLMYIFAGYFGFLLLIFIVAAYVRVRARNYLFNQTKLDGELQLASAMTVASFFGLILTNLLITLFTLGFGHAWVAVRTARYMASVTAVEGDLSQFNADDHNANTSTAIADEVADAFDINLGII
ncbi:YjgN family protein [Shewanella sp. GutDb-MelDb]|uniref:YjgN family protein n=1 Tax=Shewanella sp. GutDb-MelDb TaxID=2058316 RepID=UPI000C7D536B|nr:YjgN family protein [Shewanella sp. GutDb-MelDb]PKG57139.1 DUF898 domain-containing protein [Shewanella sp. GutDb-MelDb]